MAKETLEMHLNGKPAIATIKALTNTVAGLRKENDILNGQYATLREEMKRLQAAGLDLSQEQKTMMIGLEKQMSANKRTIKELEGIIAGAVTDIQQLDKVLSGTVQVSELNMKKLKELQKEMGKRMDNMGSQTDEEAKAKAQQLQTAFRIVSAEIDSRMAELKRNFMDMGKVADDYIAKEKEIGLAQMAANSQMVQEANAEFLAAQQKYQKAKQNHEDLVELLEEEQERLEMLRAIQADENGKDPVEQSDIDSQRAKVKGLSDELESIDRDYNQRSQKRYDYEHRNKTIIEEQIEAERRLAEFRAKFGGSKVKDIKYDKVEAISNELDKWEDAQKRIRNTSSSIKEIDITLKDLADDDPIRPVLEGEKKKLEEVASGLKDEFGFLTDVNNKVKKLQTDLTNASVGYTKPQQATLDNIRKNINHKENKDALNKEYQTLIQEVKGYEKKLGNLQKAVDGLRKDESDILDELAKASSPEERSSLITALNAKRKEIDEAEKLLNEQRQVAKYVAAPNETTYAKNRTEKLDELGAEQSTLKNLELRANINEEVAKSEQTIAEGERLAADALQEKNDAMTKMETAATKADEVTKKYGLSSAMTTKELKDMISALKEQQDNVTLTSEEYAKNAQRMADLQKILHSTEMESKKSMAEGVLRDPQYFSDQEIKESVKSMNEYIETMEMTKEQRRDLIYLIAKGEAELAKSQNGENMARMERQFDVAIHDAKEFASLSDNALQAQQKFWLQQSSLVEKGSEEQKMYLARFRTITDEVERRQQMVDEIGAERLREEGKARNWGETSDSRLGEIRKQYASDLAKMDPTADPERYREYKDVLTEVIREEERRKALLKEIEDAAKGVAEAMTKEQMEQILAEPLKHSAEEVQKAMKMAEEEAKRLFNPELGHDMQSGAYRALSESINKAKDDMEKFNADAKKITMLEQMKKLGDISREAMKQQENYWKGLRDNANSTADQITEAKRELILLNQEATKRAEQTSNQYTLNQDGSVTMNGQSIEQVKQDIEILEAYREKMEAGGEEAEKMGKKIAALKDVIKANSEEAKKSSGEDLYSEEETKKLMGKDMFDKGIFKGSMEELEKLKKSIQHYRKDINLTGEDGKKAFAEMELGMERVERAEKAAGAAALEVGNDFKNKVKKMSLGDLEKTAERLKVQLRNISSGDKDFAKLAKASREVNTQLQIQKQRLGEQTSLWDHMTNSVVKHVTALMSFRAVWGKTMQTMQRDETLSDLMTNVEKVSGLTAQEVHNLTDALEGMDTRTQIDQLLELSEQAGKLGVATRNGAQGVMQFAVAGQKITNTLGEIGGAEAISDLLKVNDLINKGSGLSLEESLYKIGSGVLSIGNNSKASYKDVVEFTQRLGSIGAVSKMTMQQVMALGGTFSALGGNVESSSTAMGRILLGLTTRTKEIAEATKLSTTELQNLVSEGKTFEALTMVLDSIKEKGSTGVVELLTAIGGKNNTQAKAALSTLVTNMDELNYQLVLAEEGYKDGTLVTNEFNKANDNLAGTMQRVRNEWDEITTNPSTTGFFNTLAHWLLSIVKTMKDFPFLLGLVVTGMLALMTATSKTIISVSALKVAWDKLKTSFASISGVTWLLTLIPTIIGLYSTFTKKSENLSTAIKDATAEADEQASKMDYLAMRLENAGKEVGSLRDTLEQMHNEMEDGTQKTKEYEDAEKDLTKAKGEHSKLITEFNNKYGQYLDFIIKDTDSSEMLAAAKRKVAAAIREEALARIEAKMQEQAWSQNEDKITGAGEDVASASKTVANQINNFVDKDYKVEGLRYDLADKISEYVSRAMSDAFSNGENMDSFKNSFDVTDGVNKIVSNAMEHLDGKYKDIIMNANAMQTLVKAAESAKDAWGDYYAQRQEDEKKLHVIQTNAQNELKVATEKEMQEAAKQIEIYQSQYEASSDDGERINLLDNIIQKMDSYMKLIEAMKRDNKDVTAEQEKQYGIYAGIIGSMRKSLSENLAKRFWGSDGEDLKEKKVETLVARYKELNDAVKKLGEGMSYAEALGEGFANMLNGMNPEDATKAVRDEAERIKNELDRRGLNTEGNFKWGNQDKNKWKTDTKEEMDSLLSALDDYYVRRQMVIEKRRIEERMTEEEFNRMTEELEREHQDRRGELQQEFLGKEDLGLRKWIEENANALDIEGKNIADALKGIIEKTNFGNLYKRLAKLDKEQKGKLFAGIQLSIDKGSLDVQKSLRKMNEDFRKALLETDPMDVMMDNYREKLEKVGLLFTDKMEHNERELFVRMQLLEQVALDIRNIGVGMLENMFDSLGMDDLVGLTQEQYAVMHNLLTQMSDDYDEALRKMMNARKKNADALREGDGSKKLWDDAEGAASRIQGTIERMNDLSGAGDDYAKRAGRDVYYVKAEAAQAYLDVLMKINEAELERIAMQADIAAKNEANAKTEEERAYWYAVMTQKEIEYDQMRRANEYMLADAKKAVNDSIQEYTDAEIERINALVAQLQPYSDALTDFSESFGEAVFGSKEDRQEAARDLLRSVVQTTGELTKQWLIQWATKAAINKMMVAEDQARAAASTAISGQEAGTEMAIEGSTTAGVIASSGAKATAKEVAKRGLVGLAIGAAISAALGALMGLALGRINKAKSEISQVSSTKSYNGRMAATMLTYAEGTDPVMGSDGKVYDAKRVNRWKTGLVKGAHYGIVGEKGTELIVDAGRTKEVVKRPWLMNMVKNPQSLPMQMDYAMIARSIRILEQNGGMPMRGMRLYADGNVDELARRMNMPSGEAEGTVAGMSQETAVELNDAIRGLKETLSKGIKASINMYGDDGLHQSMKKAERYYNR